MALLSSSRFNPHIVRVSHLQEQMRLFQTNQKAHSVNGWFCLSFCSFRDQIGVVGYRRPMPWSTRIANRATEGGISVSQSLAFFISDQQVQYRIAFRLLSSMRVDSFEIHDPKPHSLVEHVSRHIPCEYAPTR